MLLHGFFNFHLDYVGVLFLVTAPLVLVVSAAFYFKLLAEGQRDEAAWGLSHGTAAARAGAR